LGVGLRLDRVEADLLEACRFVALCTVFDLDRVLHGPRQGVADANRACDYIFQRVARDLDAELPFVRRMILLNCVHCVQRTTRLVLKVHRIERLLLVQLTEDGAVLLLCFSHRRLRRVGS